MSVEENSSKEETPITSDMLVGLSFGPDWARNTSSSDSIRIADEGDGGKGRGRGRSPRQRTGDGESRGRGGSRDGAGRGRRVEHTRERPQPVKEEPRGPSVLISVIPSQARLAAVCRYLRQTSRAYPVTSLAERFLAKEDSYFFKLEVENKADFFFQCAKCGMPAADEASLQAHIIKTHFNDFFDREETVGEAPAGTFVVIQKCGLSGKLLGPPNYHGTAECIREVQRTLYPDMPDAEYRRRIETVRDEAVIEQWKQECAKQTLYVLKEGEGEKVRMKWAEAETYMMEKISPSLIKKTRRATMSATMAGSAPVREWRFRTADLIQEEKRRPGRFVFALRAALRGMRFELINIPGRGEHVISIKPVPLNAEHAVQNVKDLVARVKEKPGVTRAELEESLEKGADDIPAVFSWLVGKGHLIELHDGGLWFPPMRTR